MLEDCEDFLQSQWRLKLKESSLEVLPVWGYGPAEDFNGRWQMVSESRVLGHYLQASGSIETCFQKTVKAAWRAFWGNIGGPTFQSFHVPLKMKRLQTLVF